jgi:tRNA 2-thiouridine synthesizing protein A
VDRVKHPDYQPRMTQSDTTLDALGLLCPLPVLKARKRLQSLPNGAVLKLLADDPAAVIDVPHFCAESGHALVHQDEADGHQIYLIRKGG